MLRKLIALPLLLSATLAFADPAIVLTAEGTGTSKSAGLANGPGSVVTHDEAGAFTDLFTVALDGPSWVDAQLSVDWINMFSSMKISFNPSQILLNGNAFHLASSQIDSNHTKYVYELAPFLVTGNTLTLSVSGVAAPDLAVGDEIMASYSGQININAVPEPASLALVGAALAGMAIARRRKV